jgi:hypothetical protein
MDEAREKLTFDVFLSHHSQDKPAVRAPAALLRERATEVWLDEKHGYPRRIPELEDAEEGVQRGGNNGR